MGSSGGLVFRNSFTFGSRRNRGVAANERHLGCWTCNLLADTSRIPNEFNTSFDWQRCVLPALHRGERVRPVATSLRREVLMNSPSEHPNPDRVGPIKCTRAPQDNTPVAAGPTCAICFDPLANGEVEAMQCAHVFHTYCLYRHFDAQGRRICIYKCTVPCPDTAIDSLEHVEDCAPLSACKLAPTCYHIEFECS